MKNFFMLCCFVICTFLSSIAYAANQNVIYIYQDEGVSEESLAQTKATFESLLNKKYIVKTIDAQQIKRGIWTEDAVLFIMPGGADLPYVKQLNGLGNQKIKQYVEEGGSFLGICAGAYYASSYVEFDKSGPLEVLGDRELKFFSGKAIGPVLAPYDYKTQSGSRAAEISTIFKEVPKAKVYYNGGGFFENAEKFANTKVIARYENGLPSIILALYGKGNVLLSGVHFEYNPYMLDLSDEHTQKISQLLIEANKLRNILTIQLLRVLGISE